jgi:hypothetical protein
MTKDTTQETGADTRSNKQLLTEWRKLNDLKRQLVKEGHLSGDCNLSQMLAEIRKQLPPNVLG